MSFSVNVKDTNFEYCGKGLKGILAQSSPILLLEINPRSMDITEFNYNDVCDYLSEYRYILLGSEQKKNIVSSRQTEFLIFVKEEKVQSNQTRQMELKKKNTRTSS